MNRASIEELLKSKGLENPNDVIDEIMRINGKDIEDMKKQVETLQNKLNAYGQGGEKYIDPADYEALKTYKTESEQKQQKEARRTAVKNLLSENNADEKTSKILIDIAEAMDIKLTSDGKVKDGEKLIGDWKQKYGEDVFAASQPGGGLGGQKPSTDGDFHFNFTKIRDDSKK